MKSIIFDFETVDNKPTAVIATMAAIVFDHSANQTFEEIIQDTSKHFTAKFLIDTQVKEYGRTIGKNTLDWWKKQTEEVRSVLKPSAADVDLLAGIADFKDFCDGHKIDKYSFGFCRGASFDFPVMADVVHKHFKHWGLDYSMFPVPFWNQRDVRSYLDGLTGMLGTRVYAAPKGALSGFVKHNALHDCAKDIYLMQQYRGYSNGQIEIPEVVEEI